MRWLRKLKQWVRFRRHDDAYATTRERLWLGIKGSIDTQLKLRRSIWLVAHFPDTFVQLQEQVSQWGLAYSIVRQPITIESLAKQNQDLLSPSSVHLVLADLVPTGIARFDGDLEGEVAALVVERHPWMPRDTDIQDYFKNLSAAGLPVELGYFMAFDDPVVAEVLNETTIEVLNQLGLASHRMINSMTLTRRIEKQLLKKQSQYNGNVDADNVEQWLRLNDQEPQS